MMVCKRKGHSVGCWDLSPCGGWDNGTHLALLNGDNIGETAQHPGPICKHRNFWLLSAMRRANDHGLKTLNYTNLPRCSSLSWWLFHTAFHISMRNDSVALILILLYVYTQVPEAVPTAPAWNYLVL